jgi:hypothetical protein
VLAVRLTTTGRPQAIACGGLSRDEDITFG